MKLMRICILVSLAAATSAAMAQELPADPAAAPSTPVAAPPVDVEILAGQVKQVLKATEGLPADAITVSTHANTIVLNGEVDTEGQLAAAVAAAQNAAGGVRISANVEVRPLEERSVQDQRAAQQSAQLVRDVQAALKADSRTANLGITVSSADPETVVLQGLVPSHEARTTLQTVVSKVKGVTRIDNRVLLP